MYRNLRWKLLLLLSVVVALVMLAGTLVSLSLATATSPAKATAAKPIPTSPSINQKDYHLVVLGDSLAKGTGDETGKGFGGYYTELLRTSLKKPVTLHNLGVNGDVSAGLRRLLGTKDYIEYVKAADLILVSIGGNEISRFRSTNLSLASEQVKMVQDHYSKNVTAILKQLRSLNSGCTLVFLGLYNPFGTQITKDKVTFLNNWNYTTEQLVTVDQNVLFLPTYDLFRYNLTNYLTSDNFHPNGKGYEAIAKRIAVSLESKVLTSKAK